MKLLVLGASGFIGKNLLASLARAGDEVVATYNTNATLPVFAKELGGGIVARRCDVRDEQSVRGLFEEFRDFDRSVYLACDTRVGHLSSDQPADVVNNILPMANFVKHYAGGPVLFFSSGAVYMGQRGEVSHENVRPSIPYAISKLASELYLQHQAIQKSFGSVIVRFFGAYGPHEPERKITRKLLLAVESPGDEVKFTVYGDGKNLIDVMYVDDAVDAIGSVLSSKRLDVVVDLCGGSAMTVNEYVEEIAGLCGKRARIIHAGSSAEYIEFRASNRAFKSAFGFSPRVSMKEGVARYRKWLGESGAAGR